MSETREEQTFWVAWGGVQKQVDALSRQIEALQREMPAALERVSQQLQTATREDRMQWTQSTERLRVDFMEMLRARDMQYEKEQKRRDELDKERDKKNEATARRTLMLWTGMVVAYAIIQLIPKLGFLFGGKAGP